MELIEKDLDVLMKGRLKVSAEELLFSLDGVVTNLQRELIGEVLRVIDEQTAQIVRAEAPTDKYMEESYAQAVEAVDAPLGIAKICAHGPDFLRATMRARANAKAAVPIVVIKCSSLR